MSSPAVKRLLWAAELLALASAAVLAVRLSNANQWHPVVLVLMLFALAMIGDRVSSVIPGGVLSTAHTSMVLAIVLLGIAPAFAFGISVAIVKSALKRLRPEGWLNNLVASSLYPIAGGLLVAAVIGDVH